MYVCVCFYLLFPILAVKIYLNDLILLAEYAKECNFTDDNKLWAVAKFTENQEQDQVSPRNRLQHNIYLATEQLQSNENRVSITCPFINGTVWSQHKQK